MQALRENPELMGTSVGMLRRAANTLLCLAKVSENQPKFAQFQSRLLNFTMSQLMDSRVAATISDVLFELMNSSTATISLPKMAKNDIIANFDKKCENSAVHMLEPTFNAISKPVAEKHVNFVLKKNCMIDNKNEANGDTKEEKEILPNIKESMAEALTSIIMEQEVVADTFDEMSSTSSQ